VLQELVDDPGVTHITAGRVAAQPAVDGLAADAVELGNLDHRKPVP
jgi:hypothetical protein